MPLRDQERVLAVEADAGARRSLAVDVLVRVDEDAVGTPEPPAEGVELLAQVGVGVPPGVAREPSFARLGLVGLDVVAERGRHDCSGAGYEPLGVAGHFRLGHGESHLGEQPARSPLQDVSLGLVVRLGRGCPDDVEAELLAQSPQLCSLHPWIVP